MSFGKECSLLPLGLSPELCISESLDSQLHTSPGTRPHRVKRRGERDLVLKTGCGGVQCKRPACAVLFELDLLVVWCFLCSNLFPLSLEVKLAFPREALFF